MAEIDADKSTEGFIFGENMEERVIKPPDSTENENGEQKEESESEENGPESTNGSATSSGNPLLRPSAFGKSGSGILAPSKLGNAFTSTGAASASVSPASSSPVSTPGPSDGVLTSTKMAPNPFATKANPHAVSTSDSEEDKKEKPLVAPAHFNVSTTSTFLKSQSVGFTLKASVLDKQTASFKGDSSETYKSSFRLQPAKLQSPFSKTTAAAEEAAPEKTPTTTTTTTTTTTSLENLSEPDSSSDSAKTSTLSSESAEGKKRLFGDIGSESSASTSTTSNFFSLSKNENSSTDVSTNSTGFVFGQSLDKRVSSTSNSEAGSSGGFIFGQNLASRVTATPQKSADDEEPTSNKEQSPKEAEPAAEGGSNSGSSAKSLVESAAACQAKQVRPELQEVEVKTGEEEESNVFQLNAKLYVFDKDSQSWKEKGRGQLRLNDISDENDTATSFHSRLVMRTQGSLRVVLNTKVWAGMSVDRASPKSIRLTAMDGEEGVKVFLIMAQPKDADQIFSAIDWRVQQLRIQDSEQTHEEPDSSVTPDASQTEQAASHAEKRQHDSPEESSARKKPRVDPAERRDAPTEESNDSSTVDPETEASNESFTSSPTIKSSSSEA